MRAPRRNVQRWATIVVVFAMILSVCIEGPNSKTAAKSGTQIASAMMGPEGGTVTLTEGPGTGARVVIPKGALSEPVLVTIRAVDSSSVPALPNGRRFGGPLVDFGPDGQTFAVPVTLTLPTIAYATSMWTFHAGTREWAMVPGASYNTKNSTISVQTTHFCSWGAEGTPCSKYKDHECRDQDPSRNIYGVCRKNNSGNYVCINPATTAYQCNNDNDCIDVYHHTHTCKNGFCRPKDEGHSGTPGPSNDGGAGGGDLNPAPEMSMGYLTAKIDGTGAIVCNRDIVAMISDRVFVTPQAVMGRYKAAVIEKQGSNSTRYFIYFGRNKCEESSSVSSDYNNNTNRFSEFDINKIKYVPNDSNARLNLGILSAPYKAGDVRVLALPTDGTGNSDCNGSTPPQMPSWQAHGVTRGHACIFQ